MFYFLKMSNETNDATTGVQSKSIPSPPRPPLIGPSPPQPQESTHVGEKTKRSKAASSKVKRKRLEVWDHFTKFTSDLGEQKSRCNYCHRVFF